jgi:hypothetical protein
VSNLKTIGYAAIRSAPSGDWIDQTSISAVHIGALHNALESDKIMPDYAQTHRIVRIARVEITEVES